ncbi:hypothetical protein [Neisseria iguanae]|nr:hypothetical protein [Neisseria iguanae]
MGSGFDNVRRYAKNACVLQGLSLKDGIERDRGFMIRFPAVFIIPNVR